MGKNKHKGSERKHDSLIDVVEKELRGRGFDTIIRNKEYSFKDCGEIDLYAVKNHYVLLFEMKCNDNYKTRKKAYEQMDRAKYNCFKNNRVFQFYVHNWMEPTIEWRKKK